VRGLVIFPESGGFVKVLNTQTFLFLSKWRHRNV